MGVLGLIALVGFVVLCLKRRQRGIKPNAKSGALSISAAVFEPEHSGGMIVSPYSMSGIKHAQQRSTTEHHVSPSSARQSSTIGGSSTNEGKGAFGPLDIPLLPLSPASPYSDTFSQSRSQGVIHET